MGGKIYIELSALAQLGEERAVRRLFVCGCALCCTAFPVYRRQKMIYPSRMVHLR